MKMINKEEIKGIVGGVYMISEPETGRVYVGSANDKPSNGIQKRWTNHIWKIENGTHKYFDDITKVRFEILEVAKDATEEELAELETRYFDYVERVGFELVNKDKGKVKRKSPVKDRTKMKAAQKGENNPRCKLSDDDVREIRQLHSEGVSNIELAEQFGMSKSYIHEIVIGRKRGEVK